MSTLILTFMNESCQLGTDLTSGFLRVVFLRRCFDETANQFQFYITWTVHRDIFA